MVDSVGTRMGTMESINPSRMAEFRFSAEIQVMIDDPLMVIPRPIVTWLSYGLHVIYKV
jgi:hypothetical protein